MRFAAPLTAVSLLCLAALPLPASGSPRCPGELLLSCDTGRSKILEVCLSDGAFHYRFGTATRNELALSAALSGFPVVPWPGVGQDIWSEIRFRNAGYTYSVWTSVRRGPEDSPQSAGVHISAGETPVASLSCQPGTTRTKDVLFEEIMTREGYCYHHDRQAWARC